MAEGPSTKPSQHPTPPKAVSFTEGFHPQRSYIAQRLRAASSDADSDSDGESHVKAETRVLHIRAYIRWSTGPGPRGSGL